MIKNFPTEHNKVQLTSDVIIIGGGIAGLWTLLRLRAQGYHAILLENNAIGSGQTLAAQGIIHGGLKYALTGFLTTEAQALQELPQVWSDCLMGNGEINLGNTKILSNKQYLFNSGGIMGRFAQLVASKCLASQISSVVPDNCPEILRSDKIGNDIYQVHELVVEIPSLLENMVSQARDYIYKINDIINIEFTDNNIQNIEILSNYKKIKLTAQNYIFTAGMGNQLILDHAPNLGEMQLRPLTMTVVKFPTDAIIPSLYAHWIDGSYQPKMTISTHYAQDGSTVWYLGGRLAEQGVKQEPSQVMTQAHKELKQIFPNLPWDNAVWSTHNINRAEQKHGLQLKPDGPSIYQSGNLIVGWPTKLAFAPQFAQQVIDRMTISPQANKNIKLDLPLATIQRPLWDTLNYHTIV